MKGLQKLPGATRDLSRRHGYPNRQNSLLGESPPGLLVGGGLPLVGRRAKGGGPLPRSPIYS